MAVQQAINIAKESIQKTTEWFALTVLLWIEKTPSDRTPPPQQWPNSNRGGGNTQKYQQTAHAAVPAARQ
jgi:hypothetical protein